MVFQSNTGCFCSSCPYLLTLMLCLSQRTKKGLKTRALPKHRRNIKGHRRIGVKATEKKSVASRTKPLTAIDGKYHTTTRSNSTQLKAYPNRRTSSRKLCVMRLSYLQDKVVPWQDLKGKEQKTEKPPPRKRLRRLCTQR